MENVYRLIDGMYNIIYDRQLRTSFFDVELVNRLSKEKILIPGCGALGSALAGMLARMGVRFIRIVDGDFADPSNFPRTASQGLTDSLSSTPKILLCYRMIKEINPYIDVEPFFTEISPINIIDLLQGITFTLDGLDNIRSRYILGKAAWAKNIPYVYTGVNDVYFNIIPFVRGKTPCIDCVIPKPREERGGIPVLSTTVYIASALAVNKMLTIIKNPDSVDAEIIVGDSLSMSIEKVSLADNNDCECNSISHEQTLQSYYEYVSKYEHVVHVKTNEPWFPWFREQIAMEGDCNVTYSNTWITIAECGNKCVFTLFADGRIKGKPNCSSIINRLRAIALKKR